MTISRMGPFIATLLAASLLAAGLTPARADPPLSPEELTALANNIFRRDIEHRSNRRLGRSVVATNSEQAMSDPRFADFRETVKGELAKYELGEPTRYYQLGGSSDGPSGPTAGPGPSQPKEGAPGGPDIAYNTPLSDTAAPTTAFTEGQIHQDGAGVLHPEEGDAVANTCLVFMLPNSFARYHKSSSGEVSVETRSTAYQRFTLAHETYHCFQPEFASLYEPGSGMFVGEGAAEFAAVTLVPDARGNTSTTFGYASQPAKIADRHYDAVGLYQHLDGRGVDMFPVFEAVYNAGNGGSVVTTFINALGPRGQMLWAMSEVDEPAFGGDWVWQPGGPHDIRLQGRLRRVLDPRENPNADAIPQGEVRIYRIKLPENKVVLLQLTNASGAVRSDSHEEGETVELAGGGQLELCYGDKCPCEPGASGLSMLRSNTGEALIAAVGVAEIGGFVNTMRDDEASARLTQERACCRPDGPLDPRIVGTWEIDIASWWDWRASPASGQQPYGGLGGTMDYYSSGRMRVEIKTDRTFTKTYEGLVWGANFVHAKHPSKLRYEMDGQVRGCINFDGRMPGHGAHALRAIVRTDDNLLVTRRGDGWSNGPLRFESQHPLTEMSMPMTWGIRYRRNGGIGVTFNGRDEATFQYLKYRRVR